MPNEFKHYGKLGMHWGRRKGSTPTKVTSKKAKTKVEPAHKTMTDAELKAKINRLNMEKQYVQLTAKEKSKGQKLVEDIVGGAAKTTATAYVAFAMKKGIEKAIKSAMK